MNVNSQMQHPPYEVEQDTLYTFKPKGSPYNVMQFVVEGLTRGIQMGRPANAVASNTTVFPKVNSWSYDISKYPQRYYPDNGPRDITWTKGLKVIE